MNAQMPPAYRRLCLAVDVEAYSGRTSPEQIDVQNRLLWCMAQACGAARVHPGRCERQDQGDGQLLLLPGDVDESTVVPLLLRALQDALGRVNRVPGPGGRIRMRAALAVGAVHIAATGYVGPAVVRACRLLDSAEVRNALAGHPDTDLVVVVADDLYRDVVAHAYDGMRARSFRRVHVSLPAKGFSEDAWIHVPGRGPAVGLVPPYAEVAQKQIWKRLTGSTGFAMAGFSLAAVQTWATLVQLVGGDEPEPEPQPQPEPAPQPEDAMPVEPGDTGGDEWADPWDADVDWAPSASPDLDDLGGPYEGDSSDSGHVF